MSVINFCGAETGDLVETSTGLGTVSVVSSPVRTGNYSFRCNPTTTATGAVQFARLDDSGGISTANVVTSYIRFYFRYATKPSANSEEIFQALSTTFANKFNVRITSDGVLAAYNSAATLLATGSTVLSADTWYRVEIKVGTGTSGDWEVKINGTSEISGTGNLTTNNTGHIRLGKAVNRNGQSVDYFFDDMLWSDSAYPGAGECHIMSPDANGTYQTWSIGAGSGSHYQIVDETPHNSDTDYLLSTLGVGDAETQAVASPPVDFSTINGVRSVIVIKRDTINGSIKVRLRSGSTNSDAGFAVSTTSSYACYNRISETDPATGSAWTDSALDTIESGIVEQSSTSRSRITMCCAMVDGIVLQPFTSTATLIAGAVTLAASATFTSPTFTATSALITGAATLSTSATFTKPTYISTASLSIGGSTLAASSTFAPGTDTATIVVTIGAATIDIPATFVPPTYEATVVVSTRAITTEISASFSEGTDTATIAVSTGATTTSISAEFTVPTYEASLSLTIEAPTVDISATFSPGEDTATLSLTTGGITTSISAEYTLPEFTATIDVSIGGVTLESTATYEPGEFTASSVLIIGATTVSISAEFDKPTYTATISLTTSAATTNILAEFDKPVYSATLTLFIGATSLSSSAEFDKPIYTTSLSLVTGGTTVSIAAEFDKPVYTGQINLTTSAATTEISSIFVVDYKAIVSLTVGNVSIASIVDFIEPLPAPVRDLIIDYTYTRDIILNYDYPSDAIIEYTYSREIDAAVDQVREVTIDYTFTHSITLEL